MSNSTRGTYFMHISMRRTRLAAAAVGVAVALAGCGSGDDATASDAETLTGTFNGDGSSTVFPILEAVAEEFAAEHPEVSINVGESGTGGGFEKFCAGETDFSNASRPIKDEEAAACTKAGIEFTELLIASDGLSVVTNADTEVDCLTVEQLKSLFAAGSTVQRFSDLDPSLPDQKAVLFTPGADSGTYDFFLEEILGDDGKFRSDNVTTSEDDNVLVRGIEGTEGGIGFFGFAYYQENADGLNLVKVDSGDGCVEPSLDTVRDGSYAPLSRPLFVYVRNDRLAQPAMEEMLRFLLSEDGRGLIEEVGYVQLEDEQYDKALAQLDG